MSKKISVESLRDLMVEVFSNSIIPEDINGLKIGDFPEWDSLGNFNLLLAVEEFYEIRFSMEQMSQIKSAKQILDIC